MNKLTVGTRYPKYHNYSDEIRFDIADDGANLFVSYNSPNEKEKEQFKSKHPLEIRFVTLGGVIYLLFKIGELQWMDVPYSPHLSLNLTQKINISDDTSALLLLICLFNSSTGELLSMRGTTLGNRLSKSLIKEIDNALMKPFDSNEYNESIKNTYSRYTTKDMIRMATACYKIH